jgi:hypothetical protein
MFDQARVLRQRRQKSQLRARKREIAVEFEGPLEKFCASVTASSFHPLPASAPAA